MSTMGKNKRSSVPTGAELELLKILWKLGAATVRQVHNAVSLHHTSAYTTTLKVLQIMHEKGLVERDETNRAHVYTARYSEVQTQSSIVKDMLSKVFGDSKLNLVMSALGDAADADEIAEIRNLLDSFENNKNSEG